MADNLGKTSFVIPTRLLHNLYNVLSDKGYNWIFVGRDGIPEGSTNITNTEFKEIISTVDINDDNNSISCFILGKDNVVIAFITGLGNSDNTIIITQSDVFIPLYIDVMKIMYELFILYTINSYTPCSGDHSESAQLEEITVEDNNKIKEQEGIDILSEVCFKYGFEAYRNNVLVGAVYPDYASDSRYTWKLKPEFKINPCIPWRNRHLLPEQDYQRRESFIKATTLLPGLIRYKDIVIKKLQDDLEEQKSILPQTDIHNSRIICITVMIDIIKKLKPHKYVGGLTYNAIDEFNDMIESATGEFPKSNITEEFKAIARDSENQELIKWIEDKLFEAMVLVK